MTLENLGNIGEFLGAIAVMASLVYLALQVRHSTRQLAENTESLHLSAFEANVEVGNRVRELILVNGDVADLFSRGVRDPSNLDAVERMRFDLLCRNIFASFQAGYIRHLAFQSDPANFEGNRRTLESMLRRPGIRAWLDKNEPDWRPEFRELVGGIVADIDAG